MAPTIQQGNLMIGSVLPVRLALSCRDGARSSRLPIKYREMVGDCGGTAERVAPHYRTHRPCPSTYLVDRSMFYGHLAVGFGATVSESLASTLLPNLVWNV